MVSTLEENSFSVAVAVTVTLSPTETSPMSYSSTRKETCICSKSAI